MQNNLIGQRITKVRGDLSKAAFARALGVEPAYIGMLESGKGIPGKTLTELMCLKFNINKDWLLTGEGEMRREEADRVGKELAIYNNLKGDPEMEEILSLLLERPQDKGMVLKFAKLLKWKREIKEALEGPEIKNIIKEEEG